MPAETADIDVLLAPAYKAFPLAADLFDAARAGVHRLYPPVPMVTRVYIVSPGSGKVVALLSAGATISRSSLPAGATIAADVSASCTLVFEFDGRVVRRESNAPYSIAGDTSGGRLSAWDGLTPGPHRVSVTPFDKPGGRAGTAVEISFTIVADPVILPKPVPPPVSPPAPLPPLNIPPADTGFTSFPLAAGARQIYVRADGDDGNAGDAPNRPLRTLARAMSLMRQSAGDRILLHARDRFDTSTLRWRFSGVPGKPTGIFAYEDGPSSNTSRPVLTVRNANAIDLDVAGLHDVAFVGLHLTAADRDPDDQRFDAAIATKSKAMYGIQAIYPTASLTIEDCRIDHFMYNVSLVAAGNKGQHTNVVIRRCLLLDAWGPPAELFRGQGLYGESVHGLRIVECVFDHNGWIEGAAGIKPTQNIYRHGVYLNQLNVKDVIFEANLASRSSNYGVQIRSGGVVQQNVFYDNATCAGVGGDAGDVADNLFIDGHDTDAYGQGIAIEAASRRVIIERNVMLDHDGRSHKYPASRIHISRRDWTPAGDRTVAIAGNAIWGCDGPAIRIDDVLAELTLRDNDLQLCRQQIVTLDKACRKIICGGNAYASTGGVAFGHHQQKGQMLTLSAWSAITGDTSAARSAEVRNPAWRFEPAFVQRSRERGRGVWDDRYDCRTVVAAARDAYARASTR